MQNMVEMQNISFSAFFLKIFFSFSLSVLHIIYQNIMKSKVQCLYSISQTCLAQEFGLVRFVVRNSLGLYWDIASDFNTKINLQNKMTREKHLNLLKYQAYMFKRTSSVCRSWLNLRKSPFSVSVVHFFLSDGFIVMHGRLGSQTLLWSPPVFWSVSSITLSIWIVDTSHACHLFKG